jgi:hypothetical protein
MRGLTTFARTVVRSGLAFCAIALAVPCAAQEQGVDVPTLPAAKDRGAGRGSLVAPSPWIVFNTPVQKHVDLKLYGFHIGELNAPAAQVDVAVRATPFLTITPSYLYYSVPPSGLNALANLPGAFSDSYDEHQFRVDGTLTFSLGTFEVQARNMYVRRFRQVPAGDSNRYRGRIGIVRPVAVKGRTWRPYVSYESFYEHHTGGWNKDRVWTGVTVPVARHLSVQPSYLWERTDGLKSINYLLVGLIVSPR